MKVFFVDSTLGLYRVIAKKINVQMSKTKLRLFRY